MAKYKLYARQYRSGPSEMIITCKSKASAKRRARKIRKEDEKFVKIVRVG